MVLGEGKRMFDSGTVPASPRLVDSGVFPNGMLKHWQLSGLADLTQRLGGPYCHVTTRANLQVREVPPKHAVALIEGIQDLGLCSRGSGADNAASFAHGSGSSGRATAGTR